MKTFWILLKREFLEWRTVLAIVGILFVLFLAFAGYGMYRFTGELDSGNFVISGSQEEFEITARDSISDTLGVESESGTIKQLVQGHPDEILEIWSHVIRGIPTGMNFLLILLGVFYLADATYKERSDNSTFYYRSLPVTDTTVLLSKLAFGTIGILTLSFLMSFILVSYLHIIFPGAVRDLLAQTGYSINQLNLGGYYFQWAGFHLVQLCWLLPFAVYFLFVSTTVKARPLLTSVGVLLLAALAWKYLFGQVSVHNLFTVNFGILSDILQNQWNQFPGGVEPGEQVQLYGSMYQYIPGLRTLVSLVVAALGFWGTVVLYRRNIEVS